MKPPRLVIVTRTFWPLVGGPETVIDNLSQSWHARGGEATVLTAQLHAHWPPQTTRHGVRIMRLPDAHTRFFAERRYQRRLGAWLINHRDEFDLVYVSRLQHDAATTVVTGRRGRFPVALRAESAGLTGDCHRQLDTRGGRRIKQLCFRAAAVVAPSAGIQRELIAAGYPRDRIHLIANGVAVRSTPRSARSRRTARAVLAEADPTLAMPDAAPLAVFAGRLHAGKSLPHLINAWSAVLEKDRRARLWLVGEGDQRVALAQQVRDMELAGSITFTGTFQDIDEVLQAADLFVLPSVEEGFSMALLEAMAAGLPIVATDIPGNREAIEHGRHGLLVPPENAAALAAAVIELLDMPGRAAELGRQARRRVEMQFTLDTMVQRHVQLFETLASSS